MKEQLKCKTSFAKLLKEKFGGVIKRLRASPRAETVFTEWFMTEKNKLDPFLIAAEILAEKGFLIKIDGDIIDIYGRKTGSVKILTSKETKSILSQIWATREFGVIKDAFWGLTPRNLNNCPWDEDTKTRVLAFYWQNCSMICQKYAQESENMRVRALKSQAKTKEILGTLGPLNSDSIRSLLEPVVDRVLSQPPESF